MTATGRERVRFSGFELDLRSGELWDTTGRRVRLPRQPLRTLIALVRAQGRVVLRDDLRHELWPGDTFVDYEHGINAVIRRLRDTIGDSASAPRFIETIPGVGYRFIAPATFVDQETPTSVTADAESAANPGDPSTGAVAALPVWSYSTRRRVAVAAIAVGAVTVLIATQWFSGAHARADYRTRPTLVRLTSTSGLSIDPALSADGSLLAFASDRGGTSGLDIWLQPVAGGGPARRLTTDEGDEVEPSFSPDGASVLYSRRETGGIYRIGIQGGTPTQVVSAQRARTPRVSADGRWIVYWTGQPVWSNGTITQAASTLAARAHAVRTDAVSTLAVVPVDGGTPTQLATTLARAQYGVWSPDGRQILFLGETRAGDLDWFVIPRDGGEPRRTGAIGALRSAGITGVPIPGGWSDTQHVVFAILGSEVSNIWQLPISPESAAAAGPPVRLTFGSAEERSPSVNRTSGIVFNSIIENVDVWRLPLDPHSGIAAGSMERVTDDAAIDQMMNLTQGGTSMVFVSTRTKASEAWLRDVRTGRERQVTFDGATFARLDPGGSRVAIRRPGTAGGAEILRIADGARTPVCQDCVIDDWSADGSRLVFGRGSPAALFVVDLAAGQERPLASHPEWNLFRARFSPDGRWVVFHTTNSAEQRQVYVVPAGEPAAVPVSRWIPVVEDFGIQPSWAPDGRAIYYFSLRDGSFCPWIQSVDPETGRPVGEPRVVQHLHDPRLQAASRAIVTNDVRGNFLYVTLTGMTGNIWMLGQ